jgi:hypothetical protein
MDAMADKLANRLVSQLQDHQGNLVPQASFPEHANLDDTILAKPQSFTVPRGPVTPHKGPGTLHFMSRSTMIGKYPGHLTLPQVSHSQKRPLLNQRFAGTQTDAAPTQHVAKKGQARNVANSIQPKLRAFGLDNPKQGKVAKSELLNVGVSCAPKEQGGNCTLSSGMRVTLQPTMARAVRFKLGSTLASKYRLAIVVESVLEDSEAFRAGIRPNMVVEALISDFYMFEWKTDSLSDTDMQKFNNVILQAHFPITLLMLEAVGISSEQSMHDKDKLEKLHALLAEA